MAVPRVRGTWHLLRFVAILANCEVALVLSDRPSEVLELYDSKSEFIAKVREASRNQSDSVPIYDLHAQEYNQHYNGARWTGPSEVAAKAGALLRGFPRSISRVLDLGCGTGLTGIQLRERGVRLIECVDPSVGMRAMIPPGVYDRFFATHDEVGAKRYALIVSTAVVGTHVGPDAVSKLILSHLLPLGSMVFTLKVSYFHSVEFSELFSSLDRRGFITDHTPGMFLHADDPGNEHTVVTIKSQPQRPRPMITLWSTPRSASTAIERCLSEHPGVGSVMHDIFSGPEFGCTDPVVQGEMYDGTSPATYEQVMEYVHRTIYSGQKGVVFMKTTARCASKVVGDRDYWLQSHIRHRFLVEEPRWVIPSVHARLNASVPIVEQHVCYQSLLSIIKSLGGKSPTIHEAETLRKDPWMVVSDICCQGGELQESDLSLSWEPRSSALWYRLGSGGDSTPRVGMDGLQGYHETVRRSRGFASERQVYERNTLNDERLAALEFQVMSTYEAILGVSTPTTCTTTTSEV